MSTDYFSAQATTYAASRPTYPETLFSWLGSISARHDVAWDCATGNGQAARDLTRHFARVIATDMSAKQIAQAGARDRISYHVALAEASGLSDASVDLVTVAQALHWFDLDAFYAEVRRVVKPGGMIAVWSYGDPILEDAELRQIVDAYNFETLREWWPAERHAVGEGYLALPFPFTELQPPPLSLEADWTLAQLTGYLRSWSATARYAKHLRNDPVMPVEEALRRHWIDPERQHHVRWPLTIRAGRVI